MSPVGLLLVDKPSGPTSHDVVGWVRWALSVKQVGHCGTLDPAATGLMVVCVGPATRLASILTGTDKTYRAQIVLGRSTTTADRQGETVDEAPVSEQVLMRAEAELRGMLGDLSLAPPAFSAIHVDGVRAHALARAGKEVRLPPRAMTLRAARNIQAQPSGVVADLDVSKGTYIRSIAVELGRRLGVPAHLGALHRLAAGEHRVDHDRAVRDLAVATLPSARPGAPPRFRMHPAGITERDAQRAFLTERLLPAWTGLPIPVHHLDLEHADSAALAVRLGHGQTVASEDPGWRGWAPAEQFAVVAGDSLVVLVEGRAGQALRPRRVVALAPS